MENEPCEVNFDNPDQSTCRANSNSNGQADLNYYAQSRQTGEGFRSAAPPDCRIELCGLTPTDDNYDDSDDIVTDNDYYGNNDYDEIKRV